MTTDFAPDRTHTIRDFRLSTGAVLAEAKIAFVSYGTLAPGGRNAVLVTHGFKSRRSLCQARECSGARRSSQT